MAYPKAALIILALITCFLFSCNESSEEEKSISYVSDETVADPEFAMNDDDSIIEIFQTDTLSTPPIEQIASLTQLNRRLNKRASYFVIKTDRDTVIRCKEGTLLSIPAGAFLSASNQKPVTGEVKISVKEFYKLSDMLIAGLTTASNGNLLETGGMINIKVTSKENKDSCFLKPGKNIVIGMPNTNSISAVGMQLFNGAHNGSAALNWVPRPGIAGFAQSWRFGGDNINYSQPYLLLPPGFVFPDNISKTKPQLVTTDQEKFKTEAKIPLRELVQYVGVVTKKASAYIDTVGNLKCYKIGDRREYISFPELYSITSVKDLKVNVAVDVSISYKSHLNHDYYQKLFKMKKGNPDSLVTITVTLNPSLKMNSIEKIRKVYRSAITASEYKSKQRERDRKIREYENRVKLLRLKSEDKLQQSVKTGSVDMRVAQNYLLLNTSQLGWINCDRFYNAPARVDYLVKLDEPAHLLIVFNSIRSIMSCDRQGVFHSLPLNEDITIVGIKTDKGKLMMAQHKTKVTEQAFEKLKFEPVTVKEYKSRLEKLNRM